MEQDPEPSRRRRAPFGARLEVERDDAGVMGKLSGIEGRGAMDRMVAATREGAARIDDRVGRMPARVQAWLAVAGGLLATTIAWVLAFAVPRMQPGEDQAQALVRLALVCCAIGGPAAALYGLVRWRWPDPPRPTGAAGFGDALIEEQRQRRLWLSRLAAAAVGILHYVLVLSAT